MPSDNTLFRGGWSVKKFNATVINDIWPQVLLFSLVATMVYLVNKLTDKEVILSTQLLTVLGTVLGLVISFRTSTAYERYQDGRKSWQAISTSSRNIAAIIWIHVPNEREDKDNQKHQTKLQSVIEKKSMINLVQAFSVSLKHFLRGEPGIYYQDLYPLIAFLPRYATHAQSPEDLLPLWAASEQDEAHARGDPHKASSHIPEHPAHRTNSLPTQHTPHAAASESDADFNEKTHRAGWTDSFKRKVHPRKRAFDPESALARVQADYALKPARSPPKATFYDYFPIFRIFKPVLSLLTFKKRGHEEGRTAMGRKVKRQLNDSNVPLELILYLSSYLAWLLKCGLLQPAIATSLTNNIAMLADTTNNLERIRSTPLPFAYQAHLRMSLWLYLFFLPFQIYPSFGELVIPATAFAAFLLLGFLEIGQEIEDPFGYDENDLDVDHFCLMIQRELHEICAHTSPEPSTFLFTPWNQPFAPADRRTADDLTNHPEHDQNYHFNHDTLAADRGMTSVRRTLLKSWKDVDEVTRHT